MSFPVFLSQMGEVKSESSSSSYGRCCQRRRGVTLKHTDAPDAQLQIYFKSPFYDSEHNAFKKKKAPESFTWSTTNTNGTCKVAVFSDF